MNNNIFITVLVFLLISGISCASESTDSNSISGSASNVSVQDSNQQAKAIDSILEKLNKHTSELKSLQCKIEYLHEQPSMFGAQSLRKGILYYSKSDSKSASGASVNNTKLRVNFQTLKQDEDDEREYKEQYIFVDGSSLPKTKTVSKFEGLWLVQMDYEFKSVKYIQITEADEPNSSQGNDIFEIISKRLPMVGFTKVGTLKEQFEISLPEQKNKDSEDITQVHLKVKPNSVYKDYYVQIDFWIDQKLNLPVKIKAISTEPEGETLENKDLYEIKFLDVKVNEKLDNKVFDFQIPKDFDEPEIIEK
jgi:hypothetical protein